ncbi:54S ribosomal protein L25, mitochondrial [Elasticomyces elasticus]|nr:54S ribosomal protein L25, mitochondrial [Elasticomyces elasticus]
MAVPATATTSHILLAQSLPPRLLHFFTRFPPTTTTNQQPPPPSDPSRKTNPFTPFLNPRTQRWHGPHYSLRRQADLFKLAQEHGVLPLMPLSPKHPEEKLRSRIEHGLRVKGTGEGQRVKGKLWERTLGTRLEVRRKAMERMPDMIDLWKERGHGMGWKKFPKGKGKVGTGGENEVFKTENRAMWVYERAGSSL